MVPECPSCDHKITITGQPRVGQRLTCPSCRAELEVIWLDPVEVDFPFDDDDDDYDGDDD